jgi:hypothetical protein
MKTKTYIKNTKTKKEEGVTVPNDNIDPLINNDFKESLSLNNV